MLVFQVAPAVLTALKFGVTGIIVVVCMCGYVAAFAWCAYIAS